MTCDINWSQSDNSLDLGKRYCTDFKWKKDNVLN